MRESLLDTDILSEFLRGRPNVILHVDNYLCEFGFLSLSIITYYEILNGLLYKDAKKQLPKFFAFIELNKVLPLTITAAKKAAEIHSDLRKKGIEIGHADTLIAGIALVNNLNLVTNNTEHFKRIRGLKTENWLK